MAGLILLAVGVGNKSDRLDRRQSIDENRRQGVAAMPLQIGRRYTRQQISDLLGGSPQSYLPTANGRVVCGCFVPGPAMNPNAPEEVLFGTGGESPDINKAANQVFRQGQEEEAIPVFIKQETNEWEYVGEYLCIGITRDARVVRRKMGEWPLRGQFHGVLRFEKV